MVGRISLAGVFDMTNISLSLIENLSSAQNKYMF